jgi:hypothetical protein
MGSRVGPYEGPTSSVLEAKGAALPGLVVALHGAPEKKCQGGDDSQGRAQNR